MCGHPVFYPKSDLPFPVESMPDCPLGWSSRVAVAVLLDVLTAHRQYCRWTWNGKQPIERPSGSNLYKYYRESPSTIRNLAWTLHSYHEENFSVWALSGSVFLNRQNNACPVQYKQDCWRLSHIVSELLSVVLKSKSGLVRIIVTQIHIHTEHFFHIKLVKYNQIIHSNVSIYSHLWNDGKVLNVWSKLTKFHIPTP